MVSLCYITLYSSLTKHAEMNCAYNHTHTHTHYATQIISDDPKRTLYLLFTFLPPLIYFILV